MFIPNYFIAKPGSGLLKVSLVDSSIYKGSGDCFGSGEGLSKEGLEARSVPCLCLYSSGAMGAFLTVYMLSKVQKENNIPEQIKMVWNSRWSVHERSVFEARPYCFISIPSLVAFATKTVWPASPQIITICRLLQKAVYWLVPKCAVFSVAHENVHLIIHALGRVLILKVWSPGPGPLSLDKLSVEALALVSLCWGDRSRDWVSSIVFSCALCSRSACTTRDSVCRHKHLPCVHHAPSLHGKQNMGIFSWLLVMSFLDY